jgi:hypothetical protein
MRWDSLHRISVTTVGQDHKDSSEKISDSGPTYESKGETSTYPQW